MHAAAAYGSARRFGAGAAGFALAQILAAEALRGRLLPLSSCLPAPAALAAPPKAKAACKETPKLTLFAAPQGHKR